MFTELTLLTLYHRIFKRAVWSLRTIWLGIITVVLSSLAAFARYIGLCVRFGQPIWETMREVQCPNQVLSCQSTSFMDGMASSQMFIF